MPSHLKLVEPSYDYAKSFTEMIEGYRNAGEKRYSHFYNDHEILIDKYIQQAQNATKGIDISREWGSFSTYWLVNKNNAILGVIRLRHQLTDVTKNLGGHIGYDVPHKHRGKGYGTQLLGLALEKARHLGIKRLLITCSLDNIASRKIIEHNGGILEKESYLPTQHITKCRYWITL